MINEMKTTPLLHIAVVILLFVVSAGCESKVFPEKPVEDGLACYRGFWQDDSGLYYFDMSGEGRISFVFPKKSATMEPEAEVVLKDDEMLLKDSRAAFVLHLDEFPPADGSGRCMEIEGIRICERKRP